MGAFEHGLLTASAGGTLTLATDGSGGAHSADPRLRRVGWGVVAFLDGEVVGTLFGSLSGAQTVNRAELRAFLAAAAATTADALLLADSSYVLDGYARGPDWQHDSNQDLWARLWRTLGSRPGKLHTLKVASHRQLEDAADDGERPAWLANSLADTVAGSAAARYELPPDAADALHTEDALLARVARRLAGAVLHTWDGHGAARRASWAAPVASRGPRETLLRLLLGGLRGLGVGDAGVPPSSTVFIGDVAQDPLMAALAAGVGQGRDLATGPHGVAFSEGLLEARLTLGLSGLMGDGSAAGLRLHGVSQRPAHGGAVVVKWSVLSATLKRSR